MIPEPTKPNWSTEKPTREEVVGKKICIQTRHNLCPTYTVDYGNYEAVFGDGFVRYCILDLSEPEQPMELDGVVNGKVFYEEAGSYSVQYVGGGKALSFYGSTRAEAIHNANEFIRRLK